MSCGLKVSITQPKMCVSFGSVRPHSNVDVLPLTATNNGTYEESGVAYSPVEVSVIPKNAQISNKVGRVTTSTYTKIPNVTLTVEKTGTYGVYWSGYRNSTSGVFGTQLCINNVDYGTPKISFDSSNDMIQNVHLTNVPLEQGDVLTIKGRARTASYSMYAMGLTIIEV